MKAILNDYRTNPPQHIAGFEVVGVEDYLIGITTLKDGTTEQISLPKENVLKFILEDESWITIRPSGTEPKCKFYFGVKKSNLEEAQQLIDELKQAF